jgi:hypothetical protein
MMEPSKTTSRTWKPTTKPPSDGGKSSRRLRVVLLVVALLIVSGSLIAWILFLNTVHDAHFLPLCIDEYGEEFPVRPHARQDVESLRGMNWSDKNAFTVQERALLSQELRGLSRQKIDGPLVVYISAFALATPKGELCVLTADARLDLPNTWLPLREVFEHLRASKATQKLLLLDIMQPFADARRGVLLDDAAERLTPLLDELLPKDPHLSVLCACSPGQTSVVAEELGHSVFAHFLCEGLRGQADGVLRNRHPDRRVSSQELAAYTTAQVEQWVARHRQVRQTPRLYGADKDFTLVSNVTTKTSATEETPLDADYPQWLSDGWKLRDAWWDDESFRFVPETFRRLEEVLLRAEQQWRGGISEDRVREELTTRCQHLERQRTERLPPKDATAPSSLAEATVGERKPPESANDEVIAAVQRLTARLSIAKPDNADLKKETEQLLKKFEGKPLVLAWVVFAAATAEAPTPAALRFLSALLAQGQVPAYHETRWLARLAELPTAMPGDWPAEGVLLSLRTVREAEIVAAADRRDRDRFGDQLAAVARFRQQGETLLFSREPAERNRAADSFRDALKAYRAINSDLRILEDARRLLDEMLVRLPSFAPYLEIDDAPEPAWMQALTATQQLRRELAAARGDSVPRLTELTASLRNDPNSPNRLRRPLDPEHFAKLIGRRQTGDSADVKIMTALLETPWPRAGQRAALWSARNELLAVLARKRSETSMPTADERLAIAAERQRGLRRAARSLALLKLEGVEGVEKIEKALTEASEMRADSIPMKTLAEELRRAWKRRAERADAER